MQIVIPMSGFGERFRSAGYSVPKPLIEVNGLPIIEHVINLFPGETDFTFICNEEHLINSSYQMRRVLQNLCPAGRIVGIPPHRLGPIHAVRQIEHLLDLDSPVVVNYCDFTCYWDWSEFNTFVRASNCDGAIPAYKGFHPHSLGNTNYAYLKEISGWVQDIQEKQPFTNNRMNEFASSGTYYFSSAKLMYDAFKKTMESNLNIGGEFYVSLAYKPLLDEGKNIAVYPLQHFMQWGTPEDLGEYLSWSKTFEGLLETPPVGTVQKGSLVIPMAGLGKRFADEGYAVTKPLIPLSGRSMALQAISCLPSSLHQSFVLRADMPGLEAIKAELLVTFPNCTITLVPGVTEGQACTALIGLDALEEVTSLHDLNPIIFSACDNGVLFDQDAYKALLDDAQIDIIVWGARGHINAIRRPEMFGWINSDGGVIKNISVKIPFESPLVDPIVIGTFTFKRNTQARAAIDSLLARNGRVNGEFYLDSCINDAIEMGLSCHLFEVDSFISWGTPNDLKTFEYWQSCFHKWAYHPYRLELDSRVDSAQLKILNARFAHQTPEFMR
jgi:NDP-sugar pyrophosphorylase family protein